MCFAKKIRGFDKKINIFLTEYKRSNLILKKIIHFGRSTDTQKKYICFNTGISEFKRFVYSCNCKKINSKLLCNLRSKNCIVTITVGLYCNTDFYFAVNVFTNLLQVVFKIFFIDYCFSTSVHFSTLNYRL